MMGGLGLFSQFLVKLSSLAFSHNCVLHCDFQQSQEMCAKIRPNSIEQTILLCLIELPVDTRHSS